MTVTEFDKGTRRSKRGFASMDLEKRRAIARKGGENVPREKRSFSQSPNLASEAGRKGGKNVSPANRSFSRDRTLAVEAGRKGGYAARIRKQSDEAAGQNASE